MAFSGSDYAFMSLTFVLVLLGGILAFLFGYFLPSEFTQEEETTQEGRMRNFEKETDGFNIPGDKGSPSEEESPPDISKCKWLVSVSRYRYNDLPNSLEFFCSGVIVNKNKMLTGEGCNREHFTKDDLKEAVVRSNSPYFWKGGTTHKITNILENNQLKIPYNQIYIFEVEPDFAQFLKPKLLAASTVARRDLDEGRFIAPGWGGHQDQTEQIFKNKPYSIRTFSSEGLFNCEYVCHLMPDSTSCCLDAYIIKEPLSSRGPLSGRFLVTEDTGEIVAAELVHLFTWTSEEDRSYFVDLGEPEFIQWVTEIIPEMVRTMKKSQNDSSLLDKHRRYKLIRQIRNTKLYKADVEFVKKYNPLNKYVHPYTDF